MSVVYRSRLPEIAAELPLQVDQAVATGALLIKDRAEGRVPVGAPEVHLRDRMRVERDGIAEYRVVAGDDDAWYGHLVEFGTTHSSPQPFLVPSAEESRDEVTGMVAAAVRRAT